MRFSILKKLLLVVSVLLLLTSCDEQQTGQRSSSSGGVGLPAPDFTLNDMQGNPVKLSDFKGKVVLLNFWATWCPPCREEMPSMEMLYRKYKDKGLEILAVNAEKNGAPLVQAFLERTPYSFPILLDDDAEAQNLYKVFRFPESYIIDRNGTVVENVTGAIDWTSGPAIELIKSLIKG